MKIKLEGLSCSSDKDSGGGDRNPGVSGGHGGKEHTPLLSDAFCNGNKIFNNFLSSVCYDVKRVFSCMRFAIHLCNF